MAHESPAAPRKMGSINRLEVTLVAVVFVLLAAMFVTLYLGSVASVNNLNDGMKLFPGVTPKP